MMYRKIQKLHFTCMPVNVHVYLFNCSVYIEFNVGPHELCRLRPHISSKKFEQER